MSSHQLLAAIFGLLAWTTIERSMLESRTTKTVAQLIVFAVVVYSMDKG